MPQPNLKEALEVNLAQREKALKESSEEFGDLEFRWSLSPMSYLGMLGYDLSEPEQFRVGTDPKAIESLIYGFHIPQGASSEDLRWLAGQAGMPEESPGLKEGDVGISRRGIGVDNIWEHELRHKGSDYLKQHMGVPITPQDMFPTYEPYGAEEIAQRLYDAIRGDKRAWKWLTDQASFLTTKYKTQEQFIDENIGKLELYEGQAKKLLERRRGHQVTPEEWQQYESKWE